MALPPFDERPPVSYKPPRQLHVSFGGYHFHHVTEIVVSESQRLSNFTTRTITLKGEAGEADAVINVYSSNISNPPHIMLITPTTYVDLHNHWPDED